MNRKAQGHVAAEAAAGLRDLPKVATGIAGLDQVLGGGVPAGRVTILSGGPGSGKSTTGLQCLLHGAATGHPGILVMFEERAATVRQDAWSRGWDLARPEKKNMLHLMDARLDPQAVMAGEFSINGLLAILDRRVKTMRAKYVVIDAVDAILHLYDDPVRERHELYALHEWLLDRRNGRQPRGRGGTGPCAQDPTGGRDRRRASGHAAALEAGGGHNRTFEG